MFLRVSCLLLVLLLAASGQDLMDDLTFKAIKPGDEDSIINVLVLNAHFFRRDSGVIVNELAMFISQPNEATVNHLLVKDDRTGLHKGDQETAFNSVGVMHGDTTSECKLVLFWQSDADGYCRTYMIKVFYTDENGVERSINKTVTVQAADGSICIPVKVEIPEDIKEAFPGAPYDVQEHILNTIQAIDRSTYNVSGIYEGRVYIASMSDTNFELHKMNELCKTAGGYLLELDSPEEQYFVRDFLEAIDNFKFFTGANDVDNEGEFVFYNSGKPMNNVVWNKGEPNNAKGVENCVEILLRGLNDNKCSRERGFICEIPLIESDEKAI